MASRVVFRCGTKSGSASEIYLGKGRVLSLGRVAQEMDEENQRASRETADKPFGCVELWAGNERTHRHIELVGLEGDVISLPSGARKGGDLYALFSCAGERAARIVLADCVGHGYVASQIAAYIHQLIHQHRDVPDSSRLLAELNDEFTLIGQSPGAPLRLTTVVTATFESSDRRIQLRLRRTPTNGAMARKKKWLVRTRGGLGRVADGHDRWRDLYAAEHPDRTRRHRAPVLRRSNGRVFTGWGNAHRGRLHETGPHNPCGVLVSCPAPHVCGGTRCCD